MSKKLTEEELSVATDQINDINFEIKYFLQKFGQFKKHKLVDKNLYVNLIKLYDEINEFVEEEPTNLEINNDSKVDLDNFGIIRVYVCEYCETSIGIDSKDVFAHVHHKKKEERSKAINGKNEKSNAISMAATATAKQFCAAEQQVIRKVKKERARKCSRRQSYLDSRKLPKKAKAFLEKNFHIFLEDAASTGEKLKSIVAYEKIKASIVKSVDRIYPDIQVHFFGSRINGLGHLDSDLDLFLDIGDVFNLYKTNETDIKKKLKTVTTSLKCNGDEWNNFVAITDARVPILKVFNKKYRIDCDIGFSNSLGKMNTILTKYFFELQPICYKMCLFIKKWLSVTTLKLQFSTYTFVMMVIFFLQINNLLPSIKQLQDGMNKPFEIGPWQGDFDMSKRLNDFQIEFIDDKNNKKCCEYLIEFFKYFKSFNFEAFVISPYCGKLLSKRAFNTAEIINELPRYADYYKINPNENTMRLNTPMCVQDPFELSHNIAKGISGGILDLMKVYCEESVKLLSLNRNY